MEKHLRNCKGHREVKVMEVPEDNDVIRTRAIDLALSEVNSWPTKRRKVDDEVNLSSSVSQFTSPPRQFVTTPENSFSQANAGNSVLETGGSKDPSSGSSSYEIPASCCSSNRSTEEEIVEIGYSFRIRHSRETTPSSEVRSESGELESTERPLEANSSHRQKLEDNSSAGAKLEAELEQFFLAGEKQHLKQFSKKYNFDFENEKPLEGRFEWVKLKP